MTWKNFIDVQDLDWVRSYEVNETLHRVIKMGGNAAKYASDEVTA